MDLLAFHALLRERASLRKELARTGKSKPTPTRAAVIERRLAELQTLIDKGLAEACKEEPQ